MAEMKAERMIVKDYLTNNRFVIPLYQRNYAWGKDECQQLWEDIYNFYCDAYDAYGKVVDDEYFLGSIVVYKSNKKLHIIDGQQRTTTLLILIRAIYEKARKIDNISKLNDDLKACLWDVNPLDGNINFNQMHLVSEVITDYDRAGLENIFKETLVVEPDIKKQSIYEKNLVFFQEQVDELAKNQPTKWYQFCLCLLNSCMILPIECDERDKALRIFNNLNNRGLSLSAADIFKGLIFKDKNDTERQRFAQEWKELANDIQNSSYIKHEDMSFLFLQCEHIIRALNDEVDTVMPGIIDFWTKKDKEDSKKKPVNFGANYGLLHDDQTFQFIIELGKFWCDPYEYLSHEGKKYFMVLNMYQNRLWQMVVSMIFYKYHKDTDTLKTVFDGILPQIIAYCALGLMTNKGGSSGLFWGFMKANTNIRENIPKIFEKSQNFPVLTMPSLENFVSFSQKATAKQIRYILAAYALLYDKNQETEWNTNKRNFDIIKSEIEHIFPKKWNNTYYNEWNEKDAKDYLDQIGNKMLLEKKLNIKAGNNYFVHKKEEYKKSNFKEAQNLSNTTKNDWNKEDIEIRNKQIYERYDEFFKEMFSR